MRLINVRYFCHPIKSYTGKLDRYIDNEISQMPTLNEFVESSLPCNINLFVRNLPQFQNRSYVEQTLVYVITREM
jgi:hypothetical protein